MSHPIIYALGNTQNENFPLILTIGREPNYDDDLMNIIGNIDVEEFRSMSGGVWVTAYTQIAKQYLGAQGTASQLKAMCFQRNSSPILFSNAFPVAIPHDVINKIEIRKQLISKIPDHVDALFSNSIISRVRLVVQHGTDSSEVSRIAKGYIEAQCHRFGILYISSPFFYNGNSAGIQQALMPVRSEIISIMSEFMGGSKIDYES